MTEKRFAGLLVVPANNTTMEPERIALCPEFAPFRVARRRPRAGPQQRWVPGLNSTGSEHTKNGLKRRTRFQDRFEMAIPWFGTDLVRSGRLRRPPPPRHREATQTEQQHSDGCGLGSCVQFQHH